MLWKLNQICLIKIFSKNLEKTKFSCDKKFTEIELCIFYGCEKEPVISLNVLQTTMSLCALNISLDIKVS